MSDILKKEMFDTSLNSGGTNMTRVPGPCAIEQNQKIELQLTKPSLK
jgi:hypothetical protein